jgi:type IV secretion system protein VirB11
MSALKASFAPGVVGLLAPLQDFLEDSSVSEILINRPNEVFVETKGQMVRFDIPALSPQYLRRLFLMIANENQQTLSESSPILSGNLFDGSRVQLVIPPASLHETLSIRKFVVQQLDFEDYEQRNFFKDAKPFGLQEACVAHDTDQALKQSYEQRDWLGFLRQAILAKKNIVISGATSSGKTTFLNSCVGQIPLDERLITLEDTYEINVPHKNLVQLKALKSFGNQTTVTMQDLVQASLRLRPDRIIMGEIRGREIFDFVSACSTGHSGALATIHANNPRVAFMRMAQLYKLNNVSGMSDADIHRELHEVIDIIVQLQKTEVGRQLVEVYYKHA